jgi:hypothetical protein
MASQNIHFPYPSDGRTLTSFEWRPIRYRNIISILKNPFYAGVYAYGKSEKRTTIVDGRTRKIYGHRKPMGTWEVFIQDHHEMAATPSNSCKLSIGIPACPSRRGCAQRSRRCHSRIAVASMSGDDFAARLERAIERSGKAKLRGEGAAAAGIVRLQLNLCIDEEQQA